MNIFQKKSPSFNARKGCDGPSLIVLHATFTKSSEDAEAVYLDPDIELSCHYMVNEDGSIIQYVHDKDRAWHAGKSYWNGEKDINSHSIGIEIQNTGHEGGLPPYPQVQIEAVIALCQDLMTKHAIDPKNILAHSDISPGRKIDPGEHFPWKELADNGIGLWPDDLPHATSDIGIATCLKQIGYDPNVEQTSLIREFQRRYEPDLFTKGQAGQVTIKTHDLANRLLQHLQQ